MLGTRGSEQYRVRVGFGTLVVGLLLLFWAWASWFVRSSGTAKAQAIARVQSGVNGALDGANPVDRATVARALWLFLIFGGALVLLVIFGTYALVRAGRRYRATLEPSDRGQSDDRDAWAMHTAPSLDEGEKTDFGEGLTDASDE